MYKTLKEDEESDARIVGFLKKTAIYATLVGGNMFLAALFVYQPIYGPLFYLFASPLSFFVPLLTFIAIVFTLVYLPTEWVFRTRMTLLGLLCLQMALLLFLQ